MAIELCEDTRQCYVNVIDHLNSIRWVVYDQFDFSEISLTYTAFGFVIPVLVDGIDTQFSDHICSVISTPISTIINRRSVLYSVASDRFTSSRWSSFYSTEASSLERTVMYNDADSINISNSFNIGLRLTLYNQVMCSLNANDYNTVGNNRHIWTPFGVDRHAYVQLPNLNVINEFDTNLGVNINSELTASTPRNDYTLENSVRWAYISNHGIDRYCSLQYFSYGSVSEYDANISLLLPSERTCYFDSTFIHNEIKSWVVTYDYDIATQREVVFDTRVIDNFTSDRICFFIDEDYLSLNTYQIIPGTPHPSVRYAYFDAIQYYTEKICVYDTRNIRPYQIASSSFPKLLLKSRTEENKNIILRTDDDVDNILVDGEYNELYDNLENRRVTIKFDDNEITTRNVDIFSSKGTVYTDDSSRELTLVGSSLFRLTII